MTSKFRKLVILDGHSDFNFSSDENIFSYSLNQGRIISNSVQNCNSSNVLHKHAFKLKHLYIDEVASINKLFIKDLIFKKIFSYFFLTDLSCKRTEFLNSFLNLCHLSLIKEIIHKKNINEIILINCNDDFRKCLKSFYIKKIIIKNNIKNNIIKFKFYNLLRQIKYIIKISIFITFIKIISNKNKPIFSKKIFFSSFPKNFKGLTHEKYGNLVKKDDKYLISLVTDFLHQNLSLLDLFSNFIKINDKKYLNKFIILDKYINYIDIISFVYYFVKTSKIYNLDLNNHYIDDINISPLLKTDLQISILRIPRLILLHNSLKRISEQIKFPLSIYYYLFEYSFGRLLTFSFMNNKNIKKVGFQHGPSGFLKFICFLSKIDIDQDIEFNLALPDEIIAEDNLSKKIYESGNYKNIFCLNKIPRLYYLDNIKRNTIKPNHHLIVAGLHDGFFILNKLRSIIEDNPNISYLFKPHPKSEKLKLIKFVKKSKLNNLFIANDHISDYLNFVDKVYFGYSSVGQEADYLGIKIEIIYSNIKINESIYCREEYFKNI